MSGLLQGRIALVTGASGSIGSAVARRFAEEGASVVLAARDVERMKALCESIQGHGGEIMLAPIDLQDYESVGNLALSLENKFGVLDILVSTAAVLGNLSPVHECDVAKWKEIIGVNLHANWYLIRHFDSLLKQSSAGRAIFVTSESTRALLNYSYFAPYATSKAALEALVQVYAAETKHSKLCINIVYPGQVDSNIYTSIFSAQDQAKLVPPYDLTDKFVELAVPECNVTGQMYDLSECSSSPGSRSL
ncbi:SDR family NAD(P)-dependent oxidoreductase [Candidatus Anaplasma sp. TIGMIC]|nr:SDR family oxidoreductase [Candidatus Anaplasma sp. TIGMIC]MDB1135185.1 SDR family NAD(P)-dependent oxidoreductase [Candidatus Anaplasma sp. TIGMIC]